MTNDTLAEEISGKPRYVSQNFTEADTLCAHTSRGVDDSNLDSIIDSIDATGVKTLGDAAILLNTELKKRTQASEEIKTPTKWNKFKDYAKSVYANKFTLLGYASTFVVAASMIYLGDKGALIFSEMNSMDKTIATLALGSTWGILGLAGTSFGYQTYDAYVRTKKIISRYGSVKKEYIDSQNTFYCTRVGAGLAVREAGLEDKLKK